MDRKHVLLTGAAGQVGGILRSDWGGRYRLRLADLKPVEDATELEEIVRLDITELEPFVDACRGIDTVVHLAADRRPTADFYETLLSLNIIGAYNAFEAARIAGCRRVVFASSVNAVLGYAETGEQCTPDMAVYPINVYGATKCWGEAVARVYAHRHGLSCIAVRLTTPSLAPDEEWDPKEWQRRISPRDTARLFGNCVDADESVKFAIVHGASRHPKCWLEMESTREAIGYEPEDGLILPR
jgi:NAD+ dependent glucose-6-phosphate dehydrogenase